MTTLQHGPAETFRAEHLNLVYASALRQMPGDSQSAADVTQAVFLVAQKKASSNRLPEDHRMTGWLLKITAYAVKESRRAARRRSAHETQAATQPRTLPDPPDQSTQTREITTILDQSLLKLGTLDREVLIRRYLRDEPLPAVAAAINMNENTTGRRIARALEKLRKLLAHRGITAPAATLTAILLTQAAFKPPAALAAALPANAAASSLAKLVLWRLTLAKTMTVAITAGIVFLGAGAIAGALLAGGNPTPPGKPGTLAATAPAATVSATQMISVTAVTEDASDKLLQETLAGIDANRKKLKTIEVESIAVFEYWDPETKTWKDGGRVEGTAFSETAEPRRTRLEVALQKPRWIDGAAPFTLESFTEVWDGTKTRRLYGPPYTDPRGDISDKRIVMGSGLLGESYSLQTMQWIDALNKKDPMTMERLGKMHMTARHVVLNRTQNAVELTNVIAESGKFVATIQCWFDPNRGYGLLGQTNSHDGEPPAVQMAVDELAEAAPGIFYPSKGRMMFVSRGIPSQRMTFTATKVTANKTFDAKTFELKFPEGLSVSEQRNGTSQPATQR